jgi:tetratricopeptide (TPR) repeat protein
MNIFTANKSPDQSTTGLNGHFVHSLLLIDVLLRMQPVETDKQELIKLCKKTYKDNKTELNILREFQEAYSPKKALRWYTRQSFLYKMLNKALRVQNIDVLFLFRFFIRDIHQELERNQCQSPIRVYRGQVLSKDELKNLRKSIGEFISINSFFSTSINYHQALGFLYNSDISGDLHRVIFEIDADPQVVTTKPFANISSYSQFVDESEVLFMIGSIFRIGDIHRNDDNIWIIRLTLCGDDEHDLTNLFEYMKETYGGGNDEVSLLNFGQVLHRMGKYDLAEKFYRRLLNELSSDDPFLFNLYYSLGLVLKDKNDLESSLQCFHKSLEIKLQSSPHDYINICQDYNAIGNVHEMKDHYDIALSWYQKGIDLLEQETAADDPMMAHFYNNMAIVYEKQKKYVEALNFNKKALIIREQNLPPNHPDIGLSHNNIGSIHRFLDHYDLALKHYKRSLKIGLKSLPPDHPHIVQSYINIGLTHEDNGELNEALTYLQKAANILRQSLSSQHPNLVRIEEHIQRVSSKLEATAEWY